MPELDWLHPDLLAALPPELGARLAPGLALGDEELAAVCAALRGELEAIARFVPSLVVRRQLARPAIGAINGAYWEGTVLFADLSGFTAMSGQLSSLGKQGAEEISEIINSLFAALVDEVHRYAGVLLKFGGDALTAFFDASLLGRDHGALAARAALAMQGRMRASFTAITTRAGTFQLRLRVGVHSGRVFAAEVGDRSHIELVVTGRNINRVANAQEIAEPGDVVVSREALALLPGSQVRALEQDYALLERLPAVVPSARLHSQNWQPGQGDRAELAALAERIAALRPYLPHRMPRRFLEPAAQSVELGEFRPVTVLFANFFPFSRALPLLDDDGLRAAQVLNAYYQRAQAVVHRYGGIVNKVDMYTHGDKLMALFGAPVAHEDDALRAVRSAIELRSVLAEANREIGELLREAAGALVSIGDAFLQQRIGINTGAVFAGRVGSAQRHEYTVMGQPVNLAARLRGVAAPGSIVLSASTRRAVTGRIALRELEPVRLKGVEGPVPIVEALRPQESVAGDAGLVRAELVGRGAELERLLGEARTALGGQGRVLALVGEAGVGKSRLIGELLDRLFQLSGPGAGNLPGFMVYVAECQGYEQNTAFAVARQLLAQLLVLVEGLPSQEARIAARVEELAPGLARFTPLLGDLLGLPLEETPLTAALTPEQRHERALDLVEGLVLGAARAQPLALIVDDMHWSDASSLELIGRIAHAATRAALLLVFGYRNDPPLDEPWRALPHSVHVQLAELTPEGSATLARAMLRGEPPPELEQRLERAQGNPFFIEAVVRSLIESGTLVQAGGAWQLTRKLDESAIPDSIEGVITARLDRLEEALRETLQVAAVIGRRFAYSVLDGIVQQPDTLPTRLERLEASDLVVPDAEQREALQRSAYQFAHALTRDVAYEGILYARRRDLHRRVAQRIEQLYDGRPDDQLSLLAGHYLLAEAWPQAFDYHLRAGRRAQERFANREAIALLERALQIAERPDGLSDLEPQADTIVELHERLGAVHALIGEYDLALTRYEQALDLLGRRGGARLDDVLGRQLQSASVYVKREIVVSS
jgi:class 3 adenylate cyclase/tetratricopeptide (TPR) repeat protein